jgi:hypothetical protein
MRQEDHKSEPNLGYTVSLSQIVKVMKEGASREE